MSKKVVIVGGGIIGLCAGYYLSREGHRVTIIDRDASGTERCSDKNAGMIVPSHFIPLAAPGVISQGLKWMWNPKSPFYLRPRLDQNLWKWCWLFFRHANSRHVDHCKHLLRDLAFESRSLYIELAEELGFTLEKRGLLMLCRSEKGFADEKEVAEAAPPLGVQAEICSPERIREIDPGVEMDIIGGVWFGDDCHLEPMEFLGKIRQTIEKTGGDFIDAEVKKNYIANGRANAVITEEGDEIELDELVLAGGVWTGELAKNLGLKLPMQGGKGYSFTLENPPQLQEVCSLLKEGRCAITPMNGNLRVAGTMEICGNNLSIDEKRLQGIIEAFCKFFPQFAKQDFEGLTPWSGLRPCSPDGMPYIGPVPGIENVTISTGHSMLGVSLGPVSGRIVADCCAMDVGKRETDPRIRPERFG